MYVRRAQKLASAAALSCVSVGASSPTTLTASCDEDKSKRADSIVVRLTPQSQLQLRDKLMAMRLIKDPTGSKDRAVLNGGPNEDLLVRDIILKRVASEDDVAQLESLYGNRVAFRMKGYVASKKGGYAGGFGSVRGMTPEEVTLPGFTPSFVIPPKTKGSGATAAPGVGVGKKDAAASSSHPFDAPRFVISADLPSRLYQSQYYVRHLMLAAAAPPDDLSNRAYYTGRLPSYEAKSAITGGGAVEHPAIQVDAVQLPWEAQLVIDGYLCPSSCLEQGPDGSYTCTYERKDVVESVPEKKQEQAHPVAATRAGEAAPKTVGSDGAAAGGEGDGEGPSESKCPICHYIESGPCRKPFNQWEACMKSLNEGAGEKGDTEKGDKDGAQEAATELSKCFPATSAMMACFSEHEYYDIMVAGLQDNIKKTYVEPTPEQDAEPPNDTPSAAEKYQAKSAAITADMEA